MDKKTEKLFKRLRIDMSKRDKKFSVVDFPDLKVESKHSTTNGFGNCFKKDPNQYKWKRGAEESSETIKQIEKNKKRVAVLYNKGGYQVIDDFSDPKNFGRK